MHGVRFCACFTVKKSMKETFILVKWLICSDAVIKVTRSLDSSKVLFWHIKFSKISLLLSLIWAIQ